MARRRLQPQLRGPPATWPLETAVGYAQDTCLEAEAWVLSSLRALHDCSLQAALLSCHQPPRQPLPHRPLRLPLRQPGCPGASQEGYLEQRGAE